MHTSFLVTCVGAYADSGIGTGGFVCVHEGKAHVVDKMDCTGLCGDGETVYRFVRSLGAILGYHKNGLSYFLKLEGARDVHDLFVIDGNFVCVATGENEIRWYDAFGKFLKSWQAPGQGDAWHLNCLWPHEGRLYASAFGEFTEHRGWNGQSAGKGFVMELESGKKVMEGLSGPHNPRFLGGKWMVCDSHQNALRIQDGGEVKVLPLNGFTRGLAYDDKYLYVGENANRKKADTGDVSTIAVIDRSTCEVVHRFSVPFPEIYEIVPVSPEMSGNFTANSAAFELGSPSARRSALENQVEIGLREIEGLKKQIRAGGWRKKLSRWMKG